ncbi:putative O-methyltransferase domain, plant methyltransferase dimerization [Helianthus anomalus]
MTSITQDAATIQGQARFFHHLYGGISAAALRCALELDIAGIINRHQGPITLSQIAHGIGSSSLDVDSLSRLMRFLVHQQIFDQQESEEKPLYSLNECSKFLLKDARNTLSSLAMMITDPLMFSPFYKLSQSIEEGGIAAFKTYGVSIWDMFASNPQAHKGFNDAMACSTMLNIDVIVSNYDFTSLKGTLVDVGGGVGVTLNEIVTKYPHLKGINFDMPDVVSSATAYEGVTHVGGDMFTAIPHGDSFFIKTILHNWGDDKCVQVLKNCRESMTERAGKVIIADMVLSPTGTGVDVFDEARIGMDMIMLTYFDGGKERTEAEWKKILEEAGFRRYNVIKIPTTVSIIEAYIE